MPLHRYLDVGEHMYNSLQKFTRVAGGHASIRDVRTMAHEDHQHSFFLAETCKVRRRSPSAQHFDKARRLPPPGRRRRRRRRRVCSPTCQTVHAA